jgi:hypothetical protein
MAHVVVMKSTAVPLSNIIAWHERLNYNKNTNSKNIFKYRSSTGKMTEVQVTP